jgi:ligand-binding sensor domain-containing protein/signal transduction histidine kinase
MWLVRTVVCLLAVSFTLIASGITPKATDGYTKRLWQVQDGLPEQTVQAFAQTPDGYLWIATSGGLVRFDGAQFLVLDRNNTPALADNNVYTLMTSRDGALWIGMEGGGLVRYRGGVYRSYTAAEGLSDGFVRALLEDRDGKIWVGTDHGLFYVAGDRIERFDGRGTIPELEIHSLILDHRGKIWAGGSRLLTIEGGVLREYPLGDEESRNQIKVLLETRDGTLWVGTVSGLYRIEPSGSLHRVTQVQGKVRALLQSSDGTVWIGTVGNGAYAYRQGAYYAAQKLPSNTVLDFFEDDEKNIWVATQAGMVRLSPTPVRVVPLSDAADADFGTVYRDRDGSMWVASTHLFHIRDGVARRHVFPGLAGIRIRNVLRTRSGAMWVGTDGSGIFRLESGMTRRYTTLNGLVNNFVRQIMEARDGSIWIGTDEGFSHLDAHGIRNFQVQDGLCYPSIRTLLEDRHGDIWIGTDHGISHLHNDHFVHDTATEELHREKIWAIHEDAAGSLWFGTRNRGLYRLQGDKLTNFTTAQGLASNSIYQILEDGKNNFWMSGPNGVSLLNRRELDAMADGSTEPLSLTLYGISQEIRATQVYGGTQPSGCQGAADSMWFPTNLGPINVSPQQGRRMPSPRVVINTVSVDGQQTMAPKQITLPAGALRLEVTYAPILLRSQDGVRFRYKLDGFDSAWKDAGTARVAYYAALPPGAYAFRVAAFDVGNPKAISEASLLVKMRGHFYRSPWFLCACLALLSGLVFAAYRARVRRLHLRFEVILQERSRIAREIHDTLLQGCTSVSALLEALCGMDISDRRETRELLNYARNQVRSTTDEAREAIWNLRREGLMHNDVNASVRKIAEQTEQETGIRVEVRSEGVVFPLDQMTAHELLMVIREAIHNAVRHAGPTTVQASLTYAPGSLSISVRDDGCGFNQDLLDNEETRHYGLLGMRERTRRMGGKFHLSSVFGRGTEIVIEVPKTASGRMVREEREGEYERSYKN